MWPWYFDGSQLTAILSYDISTEECQRKKNEWKKEKKAERSKAELSPSGEVRLFEKWL